MLPRFITPTIHAWLDYPVAIALMTAPFVLQLGSSNPMAFWLSVVTGIAAFVLTVFTDHKLGVFRIIPYRMHVAVDFLVGLTFFATPFVFGFAGLDAWYYWTLAVAVLIVVSLNSPMDGKELQTAGS